MKIEPYGVGAKGELIEQGTFTEGELLSTLGLDDGQSAALWAVCEAKWQEQFGLKPSRWRRIVTRLKGLFS